MDQRDLTGMVWLKSRACQDGDSCIEVARADGRIGVRDSENGDDGPVLFLGEHGWRMFIAQVRAGGFGS